MEQLEYVLIIILNEAIHVSVLFGLILCSLIELSKIINICLVIVICCINSILILVKMTSNCLNLMFRFTSVKKDYV